MNSDKYSTMTNNLVIGANSFVVENKENSGVE